MFARWFPAAINTRPTEWSRAAIGMALGTLFSVWLCAQVFGMEVALHLLGPLGASAVLLFAVSSGALAQPWSIIGSYVCAGVVALLVARVLGRTLGSACLAARHGGDSDVLAALPAPTRRGPGHDPGVGRPGPPSPSAGRRWARYCSAPAPCWYLRWPITMPRVHAIPRASLRPSVTILKQPQCRPGPGGDGSRPEAGTGRDGTVLRHSAHRTGAIDSRCRNPRAASQHRRSIGRSYALRPPRLSA